MSAGDLIKNISQIVQDYATATRQERIIVRNLSAYSTKIKLLMDLWKKSDGSWDNKELLYDGFDKEHENLRVYVTYNREEIAGVLPGLKDAMNEYFAPNPYKDDMDECDEHRDFAYLQKTEFRTALDNELINM